MPPASHAQAADEHLELGLKTEEKRVVALAYVCVPVIVTEQLKLVRLSVLAATVSVKLACTDAPAFNRYPPRFHVKPR